MFEEEGNSGRTRRVCIHCKGEIRDVSEELSMQMKAEYECRSCFRIKEDNAMLEADFNERAGNTRKQKKNKKTNLKAKISEKLKEKKSKKDRSKSSIISPEPGGFSQSTSNQ